ncbi:very-short-patch-repair endonuclease [Naumannella cuiyingiana]|uniref:Very-short-patch-repair endonuclease n=1 Tax=Naumannella cuiyingiana TaxID=1347891 RepID=A0A7Z0IKR8_9ACTN|nr:hypothetical protein [Naumannella cuiyingiana]NYI70909.1 very-short-patch-repair endonuclease [Naumannella cuiyingiana]
MERRRRAGLVRGLADDHDGVAHRRDLRRIGITREDVRGEVRAGRWAVHGRHTIAIDGEPGGRALLWWAVWESGPGAALDGVSALLADGLPGVILHRPGRVARATRAGLPRVLLEVAAINAARWATSDRQPALLLCLPVQQRLITPAHLEQAWRDTGRVSNRKRLDRFIPDICDGAHSLGELDFAAMCRTRGLPEPTRQVRRAGRHGSYYLDAYFDGPGVVVEINGAQHGWGLATIEDDLRANDLTLDADRVLQISLLGLRLEPDAFFVQLAAALGVSAPVAA